jgi:hypothetical protein
LAFRFRQSIRLLPGVRLNFGKRGVSASIGGAGATVNFGAKGVRGTIGLPGSGLSYSQMLIAKRASTPSVDNENARPSGCFPTMIGLLALLIVTATLSICTGEDAKKSPAHDGAKDVEAATLPLVSPPTERLRYVVSSGLNCRAGPSSRDKRLQRFGRGDQLPVVREDNGWALIRIGAGTACWVATSYTSTTPPLNPAPGRPALSETAPRDAPSRVHMSDCPCSGPRLCTGPRGGLYCVTRGGNKRYGHG